MADAITIKALQDASLDAKSLEEVVNGNESKQVTTRKGETYPSVKKAIKTLFENGGLPATPFKTKALMTASALIDGKYAMVTDDTVNNGLYVKTAGAWVKSEYDPVSQPMDRVKGLASYTVDDSKKIDESRNLYTVGSDTTGLYINSLGSVFTGAASNTAILTIPVKRNDSIVFKTTVASNLLAISLSNSALPIANQQLAVAVVDRSTTGLAKVLVPDGYAYIHINTHVSATMNIKATLQVNKNKGSLISYDNATPSDEVARALGNASLKYADIKSDQGLAVGVARTPDIVDHYINSLGVIAPIANGSCLRAFPVEGGKTYAVHSTSFDGRSFFVGVAAEGFSTSTRATMLTFTDTDNTAVKTITVPAGMKWGFVNTKFPTFNFDVRESLWVNEGTTTTFGLRNSVSAINGLDLNDTYAHERLDALGSALTKGSPLKGLKWAAIGDSITQFNARAEINYIKHVAADVGGMTIYNYGIGGYGYFNQFNKAAEITELDIDLITVAHGTNDWGATIAGSEKPLGNFLDTGTTTISGCIYTLLLGLVTKFPTKKIAVLTPIPRANNWGKNAATGTKDYNLEMLSNRIMEICEHFSIPCLDLFHNSGLFVYRPEANLLYFKAPFEGGGDGLHPNSEGHRVMANKIRPFLETL